MADGDKQGLTLIVLGEAGGAARRYRVNRAVLALSGSAILGATLAIGFLLGARFGAGAPTAAAAQPREAQTETAALARTAAAAETPEAKPAQAKSTLPVPAHPTAAAPAPAGDAAPPGEPLQILRNAQSNEVLEVRPFAADGAVRASDFDLIAGAMACPGGRAVRPDPALVRLLLETQRNFDKPLLLLGGRCPAHQDHPESEEHHHEGRAADIRVRGVSSEQLTTWLAKRGNGGIGRYVRGGFVHVDIRPGAMTQWRGEEAVPSEEAAATPKASPASAGPARADDAPGTDVAAPPPAAAERQAVVHAIEAQADP
jgi:hypothetical protein